MSKPSRPLPRYADASLRRTIGERIAAARLARNWSQEGLASTAGLTQASVSLYESGRAAASLEALVRIAAALGISPAQLLETTRNTTPHGEES